MRLRERLEALCEPNFPPGCPKLWGRFQGARIALEEALSVALEADACVICGGALLEEYPPYCEDTCCDKWHDYMDEHGDEHPGAVTRIRALIASLDSDSPKGGG